MCTNRFCRIGRAKPRNPAGYSRSHQPPTTPTAFSHHVIEFPLTSGRRRPCRDGGGGEIAPGFAMLNRAKRASHIDPPASSYAIMRKARPYRGENPGPGKDHRTRA